MHWIPESGHSRRVILLRGRLSNGEKTISEEFTDCATSWINCRASGPRRKSDTGRKRYTMKRAARRIRKKIRDLVDEMHKKFTKWIVEQYHTVLLPEFETKRMVKRANRRIGSKTARAMLGWSHYRFKQRLLNKTREYPWCKVVICDEHTSPRRPVEIVDFFTRNLDQTRHSNVLNVTLRWIGISMQQETFSFVI